MHFWVVNLHTYETTTIMAWDRRIFNDSVEGVTQATPPPFVLPFGNETQQWTIPNLGH